MYVSTYINNRLIKQYVFAQEATRDVCVPEWLRQRGTLESLANSGIESRSGNYWAFDSHKRHGHKAIKTNFLFFP